MTITDTRADDVSEHWGFRRLVRDAELHGYAYEPPVLDGASGAVIQYDGRELVNFASCSFLAMHVRPDVGFHFASAAARYGLATGGSRMIQGAVRPHVELEAELCRITGKERSLSFASGMLANVGFVHAMSRAARLGRSVSIDNGDTVFVLDRESHWSMWKACDSLRYGERLFSFAHNDPESLDKVLDRLVGRRVVVMFESVYSADGSVAPVGALIDVCERHGALSYVDDANGFLVYGPPNRPFHEEFQALRRVTFHMVSFSKSVGLEGGGIAGPRDFVYAFEGLAGTSSFTATMQPPTASAATVIMKLIQERPGIVDDFLARSEKFRDHLVELGCVVNETPSYITSVLIGEDDKAEAVRREFAAKGFLVPVFRYPAVRRNRAGMRLMLNVEHSDEHIARFFDVLAALRNKHRF
ncbi:aminotransferase class I/II-fold pyridoxal phosphate-dependent enzyme [Streptoalloteichus hindustanus]|uniref:8-amino-7-oxononanoate synthase n=1 Tax=Streptoalloteichus hindustanus TaxID=2017 RepID=A0A1M5EY71_STRHI|nr:pyridoxal phosphate-dependent aminotransferase family protein [Streptoalloteichus hindustanus]SHF84096.1 8-amino-7-oxononanoate synthase [Streptoalloteichus hindustanus]